VVTIRCRDDRGVNAALSGRHGIVIFICDNGRVTSSAVGDGASIRHRRQRRA
jgi:hypothetical protein